MIKKKEEHSSNERWLVSYADLITLLFALFVVLYAMSKVDQQKFKSLSKALRGNFAGGGDSNGGSGVGSEGGEQTPDGKSNRASDETSTEANAGGVQTTEAAVRHYSAIAQRLEQSFEGKFQGQDMSHSYKISFNDRSTLIRLNSTAFFNTGEALVRRESLDVLDAIAETLKNVSEKIKIEGHTDPTAIAGTFGSNWELSTARASWIARYFIGKHGIDPTRIEVSGFASYRPVASNTSESGRAQNRRIDIYLLQKTQQ